MLTEMPALDPTHIWLIDFDKNAKEISRKKR
jgi:hypothetical protein